MLFQGNASQQRPSSSYTHTFFSRMNLMIFSIYQLTGSKAASLFQGGCHPHTSQSHLFILLDSGCLTISQLWFRHIRNCSLCFWGHKLQDQGPIRSRVSGGYAPLYICLFVVCSHGGGLGSLWDLTKGQSPLKVQPPHATPGRGFPGGI